MCARVCVCVVCVCAWCVCAMRQAKNWKTRGKQQPEPYNGFHAVGVGALREHHLFLCFVNKIRPVSISDLEITKNIF